MDVSPDHEPTLIERGTDVHLNHPITAQRGTRDLRPARWESWTPHPLSCRRAARGRMSETESTPRSPRMCPGSGARRTATPPECAQNVDKCRYVRMAPPRLAETLPMWAQTNTSHNDGRCGKSLKEYTHSSKASGARPVGPLAHPHGTAQQLGGKKSYQQASASAGS
jgi:hypothetical protein